MTSEPQDIREGIFPDIDKVSQDWQKVVATLSAQWQTNFDQLTAKVQELLDEIKSLQGVTVNVVRTPPSA
jgi:hypothetical protein